MGEMNEVKSEKGLSITKILLAVLGGLITLGCAGFVIYILVFYSDKMG